MYYKKKDNNIIFFYMLFHQINNVLFLQTKISDIQSWYPLHCFIKMMFL